MPIKIIPKFRQAELHFISVSCHALGVHFRSVTVNDVLVGRLWTIYTQSPCRGSSMVGYLLEKGAEMPDCSSRLDGRGYVGAVNYSTVTRV